MNTNILLSIWLGNIAMCALFALDAHKSNSWELLTCGSLIVSSFGVLNMSLFVHSSNNKCSVFLAACAVALYGYFEYTLYKESSLEYHLDLIVNFQPYHSLLSFQFEKEKNNTDNFIKFEDLKADFNSTETCSVDFNAANSTETCSVDFNATNSTSDNQNEASYCEFSYDELKTSRNDTQCEEDFNEYLARHSVSNCTEFPVFKAYWVSQCFRLSNRVEQHTDLLDLYLLDATNYKQMIQNSQTFLSKHQLNLQRYSIRTLIEILDKLCYREVLAKACNHVKSLTDIGSFFEPLKNIQQYALNPKIDCAVCKDVIACASAAKKCIDSIQDALKTSPLCPDSGLFSNKTLGVAFWGEYWNTEVRESAMRSEYTIQSQASKIKCNYVKETLSNVAKSKSLTNAYYVQFGAVIQRKKIQNVPQIELHKENPRSSMCRVEDSARRWKLSTIEIDPENFVYFCVTKNNLKYVFAVPENTAIAEWAQQSSQDRYNPANIDGDNAKEFHEFLSSFEELAFTGFFAPDENYSIVDQHLLENRNMRDAVIQKWVYKLYESKHMCVFYALKHTQVMALVFSLY